MLLFGFSDTAPVVRLLVCRGLLVLFFGGEEWFVVVLSCLCGRGERVVSCCRRCCLGGVDSSSLTKMAST